MRILITGGTGTISRAVVAVACAAGHRVTVLNRGTREAVPAGVEHLVADARDEAAWSAALGSRTFDAVVQFVAFTPDQVERDLRVLAGRTGQYVLISSASVYAKPVTDPVITEDTPVGNPFSAYARDKIACEAVLRGRDDVPWTIVRPSHTYGERGIPVNLHFGRPWAVVSRLLRGEPVLVQGDGESLWTFTWNEDFAVGLLGLLGNPGARQRTVHITSDESLTWNQAFATLGETLGVTPRLAHVSTAMLVALRPDLEASLSGDKSNTVIFDTSLIRTLVPGFTTPTRFSDGLDRSWAWLRQHPEAHEEDPAFDAFCDGVVARIHAWA
ncbi:MAG TPA: NAD-dependent epimerase/dehydratase family protein [Propioniciclava sp.]|jgi:nucleoside-diphosphate-sugar epimerase|uniref:NAD-dependent epimerase/dehydratase family protein n=1 Tax=Propioniciclava sp. TaxID=2038686 RepID=UPI002C893287|nr:NAD-dependent epimerase/dehydratase family protein [Propioniciclava sp.]HRL49426.1 NAD-dependent epimerase/dehydratase family protein [Propioniciclava sp.]HRL79236.1 NAD-dependent epimerase/dehydratase family protein [Propioniciclava sp.]